MCPQEGLEDTPLKSCKSHEKNETKSIRLLVFSFLSNNLFSTLMFFVLFFHVVCKISNFNMWTAKHLTQASCTEVSLQSQFFNLAKMSQSYYSLFEQSEYSLSAIKLFNSLSMLISNNIFTKRKLSKTKQKVPY